MTTQPLAELEAISDLERTSAIGFKGEARPSNGLVLWGFIIMLIGVAIGVVGKKLLHADIITVVGILISLLGMFLSVYPFLAPPRRKTIDSSPSSQPQIPTPSRPKEYLPQRDNIKYVSTITERTTDLLETPAATKPAPKENGQSKPFVNQRAAKPD
jgi:hypothetical protein